MYQTQPPAHYWPTSLSNGGRGSCSRSSSSSSPISSPRRCSGRLSRIVDKMPVLKRHPGVGGDSVGTELGRLAYWLVWLVGLIAALQPLGLSGVLTPVTSLTNEVFAFLPRLLGAGLFFFAGLILARIVRHVIEAALGRAQPRAAGRPGRAQARRRPRRGRQPRRPQRRRRPGAQLDRPRGRRDRVGDDHHLRRHRRAPDPADLGDLRPGDRHAQHHRRRHSARARRAGVAGDRLPHRPLGQDADRDRAAEPRLRRQRPRARHHAGAGQSVARRRHRSR